MRKLKKEYRFLQGQLVDTFMAGCDGYPSSHSDVYRGMAAILKMFDVARLAISRDVYATEKELDDEEIADCIARGSKIVETPLYKVTVERK